MGEAKNWPDRRLAYQGRISLSKFRFSLVRAAVHGAKHEGRVCIASL